MDAAILSAHTDFATRLRNWRIWQLKRIGMGLIGPGFIAPHHIDAVRRLGDVDVIGIAGSNAASAERKAKLLNVDRAYGSYQDLIADPDISVVHNTTPSYLHFPVSMAVIEAGKHIISDKPLAISASEAVKLRDAALAAGVVNAVTFNYRGNPLVQQARLMAAQDQIGGVFFILSLIHISEPTRLGMIS